MSSSAPFDIRRLTSGDLALFEDLMTTFGAAFNEVETFTANRPSQRYLQGLLESEYFVALGALKNGSIVGGLAAYELRKFERERSEFYIYDLAVDVEHRRQGIATALIEALKKIAAERGAYVIFVQADRGDTPAIELYSTFGSREDVLHFDISVGADESS